MQNVVVYCLLSCFYVNTVITADFDHQLSRWMLSLNKTVGYICDNVSSMNVDVALGLAFTEVHLRSLLMRNDTNLVKNEMWEILNNSFQCRQRVIIRNLSKNEILNTLLTNMTDPNKWITKKDENKIEYTFAKSLCTKIKKRDETLGLLYKGFPQEKQSDYCLADLFLSGCNYNFVCHRMLRLDDECYGYPLIHRVLYILSQQHKTECKTKLKNSYNAILGIYCNRIFQSIIAIEDENLYDELRDFIMESNLICGMAGFADLINRQFINKIVKWQERSGCYNTEPLTTPISKRSTVIIDNCNTHTTAVAAATLSLCINVVLDIDSDNSISQRVIKVKDTLTNTLCYFRRSK